MKITRITAWGHNYVTTDFLAFGDYDNSSDIERANALFALRTAANAWNGEILYTGAHTIYCNLEDKSLILKSGYDPMRPNFQKVTPWEHSNPPKAIRYTTSFGEQVYIREDIASTEGLLDALQEYPLLDDETQSEVEAIIQDASWSSYIYDELQPSLPEHVTEAHAKAAFWEALKDTGNYGHIESTTWTGFDTKQLLPSILKKLEETNGRQINKGEVTGADTRH